MTKSLLAGMAVCAVLAVFSGTTSAHVQRAHVHKPIYRPHAQALSSLPVYRPYGQTWSSSRAKGGPLHDCVHITFPQCDSGYGKPND